MKAKSYPSWPGLSPLGSRWAVSPPISLCPFRLLFVDHKPPRLFELLLFLCSFQGPCSPSASKSPLFLMVSLVLHNVSLTQHTSFSLYWHTQASHSNAYFLMPSSKPWISFCLLSLGRLTDRLVYWLILHGEHLKFYFIEYYSSAWKWIKLHIHCRAPNTTTGTSPTPAFHTGLSPTHQPSRRRPQCFHCSASAWAKQQHSGPRNWGSWLPCFCARGGYHH